MIPANLAITCFVTMMERAIAFFIDQKKLEIYFFSVQGADNFSVNIASFFEDVTNDKGLCG